MLLRQKTLVGVSDGRITLAFRRWKRPTVKAGGALLTSIGQLAIDGVEAVRDDALTLAEARAAGFESVDALTAALGPADKGTIYRVRLRLAGPDPRIALREVLFGEKMDGNRIAGAVCVYLLIGLTWTFVYYFIALGMPGAFNGLSPDHDLRFIDLLYFSFVTLTTLGYGDVTPATPFARALAYLQAVTGTMYMALLVASLIGSFRDRSRSR